MTALTALALLLATTAHPPNPEALAWAPGPQIAVSARAGYTHPTGIYVTSPAGPFRLVARGVHGEVSWTRDGRSVEVDVYPKVYAVDPRGGGARLLRTVGGVLSPDGTRLAFTRGDGYYVGRRDGSHAHRIVATQYTEDAGIAWSPDGRRLAIVLCRAPAGSEPCEHQYGFDVVLVGADGSRRRRLTAQPGLPQCVHWLRNGTILFWRGDPGSSSAIDPQGRERTMPYDFCLAGAISADERFVATPRNGRFDIWTVGGRRVRSFALTSVDATSVGDVAWAPDGGRLAFLAPLRGPSFERLFVWVVGVDGRALHRIL